MGKEFRLCLANGSRWCLSATDDAATWLTKLASIMMLDHCASDGDAKLTFHEMYHANNDSDIVRNATIQSMIPDDSGSFWMCYDYQMMRIWMHKSGLEAVCEVTLNGDSHNEYINMWQSLQPIYQQNLHMGGLPFHAALVEHGGYAFLLPGGSGAGKSTCCRRLPDHWKPLCDDEALVVLDRQRKYRAHPFPTWSDYLNDRAKNRWNVQYSVPIAAIFFLEQSDIDEAIPIGEGQAAALICELTAQKCVRFWQGMSAEGHRQFRRELFDNACEMAKKIPAFRLRVSLHGRFWEEIEKTLEKVLGREEI